MRTEAPAVVLTFWPHPAVVLGKRNDLKSLTDAGRARGPARFPGCGRAVITQPFTPEFAKLSALDFMRRVSRTPGPALVMDRL
jgi:FAD synthase